MAYIQKLANGRYKAHVERHGTRKTSTWDTRREADAWARQIETELLQHKKQGGHRYTFAQAAERYRLEVSAKKDGRKWEELRIPKMVEHFSGLALADIHADHIARWRDARLAVVSGSTVLRESKLLHNIFEIARREWGWIEAHPFGQVAMPKPADPRHQRWRWQQVRRVLRYLGYVTGQPPQSKQGEVALAFLVALRTGMRSGEILQINRETYNPTTRVITVKSKTEKTARVPITRQAARVCKLIPAWTIDDALRDALFRKARDACLVGDLTFHDARATALTLLARRVDVLTLSRISRHKNLKMLSEVYYRDTAEEIAARL